MVKEMVSRIRVLSEHTINKIAAGEVIENPSSVVKELVENSIDAGATDICIDISGGGRQLIRITDNGYGMNSDDALLCLERHATSKLRDDSDIHALSTMGFRGEAIPSIASISKFNLLTCPAPEDEAMKTTGTMVIVDGGKIVCCTPAERSPGTTIEVKSLFFNVPVRKKFLKSPAFDANEIFKIVSSIALGNPSIKFQLISDGRTLLTTAPLPSSTIDFKEQLKIRVESVLGDDFSKNTICVDETTEGLSLQGVIGLPSYTRHNRTGQYLYINKRPVISSTVSFAVKDGFSTSIDSGRFPVFVLHLSVAGEWVDVNVHPQKREVRLRQEQMIRELIVKAVRKSLGEQQDAYISFESLAHTPDAPTIDQEIPISSPVFANVFEIKESLNTKEKASTWEFKPKTPYAPYAPPQHASFFKTENARASPSPNFQQISMMEPMSSLSTTSSVEISPKVIATLPRYLIIDGSSPNVFIEKGCRSFKKEGIILIDQKNAHARIIFEKLSKQMQNTSIAQQTLLVPHTLELLPHESEDLRRSLSYLNKMGIHIKEFGDNTFLIDALPQIFGNTDIKALITDILHDIRSFQNIPDEGKILENEQLKKIALAASRSAVSSSKHLSVVEGQSIVDQLVNCQQPYICPMGKAIIVQITGDELAKLFQK